METLKFKTNIKCSGCIATVTPVLDKTAGKDNWKVDLEDPNKTLTIVTDASDDQVAAALKEVGYDAIKV
ncbi:MAG TPA: cation transporter [Sphingobacteriaceae bacterium]